jgi:hypothetical protein
LIYLPHHELEVANFLLLPVCLVVKWEVSSDQAHILTTCFCLLCCPCCLQALAQRITAVLADSGMQARAAAVAQEVAGYPGVAAAADVVLAAASPWEALQGKL